jgi:hypothetical protein
MVQDDDDIIIRSTTDISHCGECDFGWAKEVKCTRYKMGLNI